MPVLTHLGVKEILVDGRKFLVQGLVKCVDHFGITLHVGEPSFPLACNVSTASASVGGGQHRLLGWDTVYSHPKLMDRWTIRLAQLSKSEKFDEQRLGNDRTEDSRPCKPDDGDNQMKEKDDNIAHPGMVSVQRCLLLLQWLKVPPVEVLRYHRSYTRRRGG